MMLAWGAKVSPAFRARVVEIAHALGGEPSWLMACMAFETGRTFDPAKRNPTSGATGLIGFMPGFALADTGATVEQLAVMTPEEQLERVYRYFERKGALGRCTTLASMYMAILWPAAIGAPDSAVIFPAGSRELLANRGLDINHDNAVTKAEAASFVAKMLAEGLQPGNAAEIAAPAPIEERGQPARTEDVQRITKQGAPMPIALAAAFLGPLLQGVIQMFAPRAQAALAKAGADPNIAGQVLNNLATNIGAAVGVPVTDETSAIQAVAALHAQLAALSDEQKRQSELVRKLQDQSENFVHDLTEAANALVDIRKRETDISTLSADAAANRKDARALRGLLLKHVAVVFVLLGGGLLLLGLAEVYYDPQHQLDGAILGAIILAFGNAGGWYAAYIHFAVGTNESSGAKDLVIGEMAARRQSTGGTAS